MICFSEVEWNSVLNRSQKWFSNLRFFHMVCAKKLVLCVLVFFESCTVCGKPIKNDIYGLNWILHYMFTWLYSKFISQSATILLSPIMVLRGSDPSSNKSYHFPFKGMEWNVFVLAIMFSRHIIGWTSVNLNWSLFNRFWNLDASSLYQIK